ncbi:MAG TPA: GNAT family N-acetyltransferase, partial [Caulobacteraceae bacterium]|nr:GNAT family N-acetyltransferase [Caulobacteraceae bacterium]
MKRVNWATLHGTTTTMLSLSDLRSTLIAGPVRLEPLSEGHRASLAAAANHAEIWEHMPSRATGKAFESWFDRALEVALTGREAVWAVRTTADGALVGSTRYMAIEAAHRR